MTFYADNETNYEYSFDWKQLFEEVALAVLDFEACPYETQVSLLLTDNEGIQVINKETRDIDAPTDVLSFPMFDNINDVMDISPLPLGDIVISLERAAVQAHHLCHSLYHEVAFLTVHSTLHLLGYDHETSQEDEDDMFRRQKEIMEIIGF